MTLPLTPGFFRYWGPMFPDAEGLSTYWNDHFPDAFRDPGIIYGNGPEGVGTFQLVLESGTSVTYSWTTDITKSHSGKERRACILRQPKQSFSGNVLMIGDIALANRGRIARYAALGSIFYLGLPYEAMTLIADAVTTDLTVSTTAIAMCDWANPGQRVIVEDDEDNTIESVIQSVAGGVISISDITGEVGRAGGRIMPAMPVYLEPQQGFARHTNPETVERWQINAQSATMGFADKPAVQSTLALEGPTTSGNLDGLFLRAKTAGVVGDIITVEFTDDALTDSGELEEDFTAKTVHIKFSPNMTTLGELAELIYTASDLIEMYGSYDVSAVMSGGDDEFAPTNLSGGLDAVMATVGKGATLTTFGSRPIWDRHIVVEGEATDSVQTLAEIVDLGAVPFAASEAVHVDWGRQVSLTQQIGPEWQWFKKFMDTVRGCWKSWWLPSWRRDLNVESTGVGTLVITGPYDSTDFFAWYPKFDHLQIIQVDGTLTYVRITGATDNSDGTLTLDIVDDADTPVTLSGSSVHMVSWLELCHFESDKIDVEFSAMRWTINTQARVVQQ